MKFEPETVKGFQDFLSPESVKRKQVKKIIENFFELYGFIPIETPIVEYDELMMPDSIDSNEDEAVSDRFRLQDRAGRNLGLRYEFTFQLQRIFKQNPNLKLPFKRYQIGPVFRDEPISSNRFRQFVQCDADIIGSSSVDSDVECLSLISDITTALGIEAEIEINNRKLLASIIESVQIPNPSKVIKEIDKFEKIGEDEVKANLRKFTTPNQIVTLLKLLEKPFSFFLENAFDGAEELKKTIDQAKLYKIKLKFNPYLARGLGYYTGNIFEVKVQGSKNTIAAGGRYDNSVGKFLNREIPAVGISFGLERITQLAKLSVPKPVKALIISIDEPEDSISLTKKLRKSNIPCVLTFGQVSKQLEYANSQEIPYVIFIGSEEISSKKFKLKDMLSGEEKLLNGKQLISKLSK
ncbi:histidine--tRNA ligase [Candidatus Pacearchaeota archaeon]|nr:histidine--tRNA ligase [Candidatus Pacearchaeota archaeon]|tara:strand:+ start:617 stop:1843 length:1227 start_codon:yes stop_codon:yes gene_type:complete